jgi:hypothetical protein
LFDLKAEPQTYEEIIARARYVRARLGITQPPKPVTIQSCPPASKPARIQKVRASAKPPKEVRKLSDRAQEVLRSKQMQRFIDANYERSYKAIDWLLGDIEKWVAIMDEPKPGWVRRSIQQFSEEHGIPAVVFFSHIRMPRVVELRCKLWLCLHTSEYQPAYCQIGRWFKRDHSTVLYGVRKHLHGEKDPYVARKQEAHRALAQKTREQRREALKAAIQAWDESEWSQQ